MLSLPLLVIGLSGALLSFRPTLQQWSYPTVYQVEASSERLSASAVAQHIQQAFPEATIFHTSAFQKAGRAWIVYSSEGRLVADPYTGSVRAAPEGDWTDTLEQVHRSLAGGTAGRYVVGGSSLGLVLLICSGLWLWWPTWRGTLRRWFRRGDTLSWHNVAGLVSTPLLVLMALTGITLTFSVVMPFVFWMTGSPALPEAPEAETLPGRTPITLAQAVDTAQAALPGAVVTAFGGSADGGAYKVHLGYPGELNDHGWERMYVDPYRGTILRHVDTYSHSAGSIYKQTWWQLHTGEFSGGTGRVVWALASLMLPLLIVTGLLQWWKKQRVKRGKQRMSPTPAERPANVKPVSSEHVGQGATAAEGKS